MVWRRSVAKRHAPTRALWEKLSARSFTPVFDSAAPTPRVTVPRRRPRLPDMGDVDTTWGGAALTSGSWTGVWGQWVIPDRGLSHTVLDTNHGGLRPKPAVLSAALGGCVSYGATLG